MDTLGGGLIINSHAPRHRRFRPAVIQNLKVRGEGAVEDVVVATLETNQPLELEKLAVQCALAVNEANIVIGELIKKGRVVAVGQGGQNLLFTNSGWGRLVKKAEAVAGNYHRKFPARSGMPKGELGSKLGLSPNSPVLQRLVDDGVLVEEGAAVRLPSYRVQLSEQQQAKIDNFVRALNQNPYSPPGDVTLEPDLLNLLIEQQRVVKVSDGVVFSAPAYQEMVDKVVAYARTKGRVTLAEVRDMLGTSRKYAQALLEYMDEKKLTRRVGDERVLR